MRTKETYPWGCFEIAHWKTEPETKDPFDRGQKSGITGGIIWFLCFVVKVSVVASRDSYLVKKG